MNKYYYRIIYQSLTPSVATVRAAEEVVFKGLGGEVYTGDGFQVVTIDRLLQMVKDADPSLQILNARLAPQP